MKGLGLIRENNETWREAVRRVSTKFGKTNRCIAEFDRLVHTGEDEEFAALYALSTYDCLETIDARLLVGQ